MSEVLKLTEILTEVQIFITKDEYQALKKQKYSLYLSILRLTE